MLSFTDCRILVVGDIMLDEYTETLVDRISPEAPVPVAHVRRHWSVPGGAANVARNLSCLGCGVTLVGLRGHDATGEQMQRLLDKYGIKSALEFTDDRPTPSKLRVVALGQQLLRLDDEEHADLPGEVLERVWQIIESQLSDVNAVVLSDYDKGVFRMFNGGDSLAARTIKACHERLIPVLVDPKGTDWQRYATADCITPNTQELAKAITAPAESFPLLADGAKALMEQYALPRILLTRSEKGMALLQRAKVVIEIPTQAREVSDVSGAGDTVIAVTAACVAKGMDWLDAARTANAAAGVVVGKSGTSPIELAELRAALLELEDCPNKELARLNSKIYSLERLKAAVDAWRRLGKKIIFTNGCFDLLHLGHVQLVQEAATQGDKLIVALNSDSSVKRLKGPNRPIQPQHARATVMAALGAVDAVILFDEDTPLKLIEALTPDILVKGGDYNVESVVGAEHVISHGGKVYLANFLQGHSTTKIISKFSQ